MAGSKTARHSSKNKRTGKYKQQFIMIVRRIGRWRGKIIKNIYEEE